MSETPAEPYQDTKELAKEAGDRALSYQFLAVATIEEANLDLLKRLAADQMEEGLPLHDCVQELQEGNLEELRQEYAAEFNALLHGMSANPLKPFESVYTSPTGLMMQDARDEVLKAYRSEGIGLIENYVMPEDHLGLELEFMSTLCQKQAAAYQDGNASEAERLESVQANFFINHIDAWVPEFLVDFQRAANTTYYRGIMAMLAELLAFERERFALGATQ